MKRVFGVWAVGFGSVAALVGLAWMFTVFWSYPELTGRQLWLLHAADMAGSTGVTVAGLLAMLLGGRLLD